MIKLTDAEHRLVDRAERRRSAAGWVLLAFALVVQTFIAVVGVRAVRSIDRHLDAATSLTPAGVTTPEDVALDRIVAAGMSEEWMVLSDAELRDGLAAGRMSGGLAVGGAAVLAAFTLGLLFVAADWIGFGPGADRDRLIVKLYTELEERAPSDSVPDA